MAVPLQNPADVVNASLRRIGYRLRVGSLLDGSEAATQSLDIYGQTRDQLLEDFDWPFAERNITLTLLKSAPAGGYVPPTAWSTTYPPPPWAFEYAWPADAIKIRALKQAPLFLFNPDPQPILYKPAYDVISNVKQRVILANIDNAIAVYTGRLTDPTTWDVAFTEAFIAALGRRLVPVLGNLNAIQVAAQDEAVAAAEAERANG